MICSPVCASRWTSRVGSSSREPADRGRRLLLVALRLRLVGERHHRRRQVERREGDLLLAPAQSTSPAWVSFSFATAPMSPAPSSVDRRQLLAERLAELADPLLLVAGRR